MRQPDPDADPCRRAWLDCPNCRDRASCQPCSTGTSCDDHWRFLLATEPHQVFLQCPRCLHRWWHQTHRVDSQRPLAADALPGWPGQRGAA